MVGNVLTKCLDHADTGFSGSVSSRTHQTGYVLAKVALGQIRCTRSGPVLSLSLPILPFQT